MSTVAAGQLAGWRRPLSPELGLLCLLPPAQAPEGFCF